MAKPLELAYSSIWNRKSIETLNATEIGAYICLTRAMLLHGHDPLPADLDTLQRLSRLTRIQWAKYRERITAALNDTVKVLKDSYHKAAIVRETRLRVATSMVAGRREAKKLKIPEEIVNHAFVEADAYGAGIIQPFVAAQYTAKNYDTKARNAAKSNTKTAATLTD